LEKDKNKSVTINVSNDKDQPCPIGREAAKAQPRGKRKNEEMMDGIVALEENEMVKMQKERNQSGACSETVSQTQVEISKTNLKAAKEQKSARLYELYNSLEKARRDKRYDMNKCEKCEI
jgi:hypothetical protein